MRTFKGKVEKFFKVKVTLGDALEKMTGLKKDILAEASQKGAVWLQKNSSGKILRERSLTSLVAPQDTISLYYDQKVLKLPSVTVGECLYENKNYGIWIKEAGVVPQGTQAGDHASLLRYIETQKKHEVFLVHRLDRETAGVMIFAYNTKAAALISDLFLKNQIHKEYEAVVLGHMETGIKDTIRASLDDKAAITHYEVVDSNEMSSLLKVHIETGRLHQIRRHLDSIHHPVMGDPKYGRGNKNKKGLQLIAKLLSFEDPWENKQKSWAYPGHLNL